MADYHFTQLGSGTLDGSTEANSDAVANWAAASLGAGDTAFFHGTITSKITVNSGGDSTADLVLRGDNGTPALFNTGAATDGILIFPIGYVTVKNMAFGVVRRGVYIITHWAAAHDITIDNVTVADAANVGIHMDTSNKGADVVYLQPFNILVKNCTVTTAALHGISMHGYLSESCVIDNCVVNEAATGGNNWGIYMSAKGVVGTKTWTGSNPYETDIVTDWGLTQWDDVKQVILSQYTTSHFTEGTFDALIANEWAQSGTTLQINMAESPNTHKFIIAITAPTGGKILNSQAYNVDNGGGSTDGVGIGFDIGMINGIIDGCYCENNDGRGLELAACDNCVIQRSTSKNNGLWGFNATGSKDALIAGNTSDGSSSHAYYGQYTVDDSITFKCNIAINAGGDDLHLTGMTSVVETHNQSYLCAVFNFDDATSAQGDPLLNADYTLQSDSPCVGNGDKWWTTGPRPSGYLGDPSPDTDVDMGADQSLFSSSHPANL